MRCLFCGKRLALLRKLTDGEFCSSAHRRRFLEEEQKLALARLMEEGRRSDRQDPALRPEAVFEGAPKAHHLAGFRTEVFAANPGRISPATEPQSLAQAVRICLLQGGQQTVSRQDAPRSLNGVALPYQPSLVVAGSSERVLTDAEALPLAGALQVCPPVRVPSLPAFQPQAPGPAMTGAGESRGPEQPAVRRPKTSVFLKQERPTPPSHARLAPPLPSLAALVPMDAPETAGTARARVAGAEPENFPVNPARFLSRTTGLRTTGIEPKPTPGVELTATGELAREVALGDLALAVCGRPNRIEAPTYESFTAASLRPAGLVAGGGWNALPEACLSALETGPASPSMRPLAAGDLRTEPGDSRALLTLARAARREPSPESAGPSRSEPVPAFACEPLRAVPESDILESHAVLPSPPCPAAEFSPSETAFALYGGAPAGLSPVVRGARLETAPVAIPAEIPSRAAAPETVDPHCRKLRAVEAPEAQVGSLHASSPAPARQFASRPPEPSWDLAPSPIHSKGGVAGLVAQRWRIEPRSHVNRAADSPALLGTVLKPVLPVARLEVVQWSRLTQRLAGTFGGTRFDWSRGAWVGAARFWQEAPADLKWLSVALPAVLLVAAVSAIGWLPFRPAPTVQAADSARPSRLRRVVDDGVVSLKRNIVNRAAVNLQDDFRSGLAEWDGRGNWGKDWQYDPAGFVLTGPLALFRPSLELADYRFEFLGQIDRKSLNWVFRAADHNNYYAMKIVLVKSGPLPKAAIVHYAVIDGKPERPVQRPLAMNIRSDTFFRVRMEVRGENFTASVQDQLVDFWSDGRLREGGVGFFSEKGERARLRWVEVSHQYDTLGRLCALLAPYSIQSRQGSLNSQ